MHISCIIVDDEPLAVSKLQGFIAMVPELRLLYQFSSAIDAVSWLRANTVDVIFLDIQMPMLTGIEFVELVKPDALVVVTTAFDSYAVKGFELDVFDYLLKPFSFDRFAKTANKILDSGRFKHSLEYPDHIFLKTENRLERVLVGDIQYVEGMKDYLRVVCTDRKIMTLLSFSKMEMMLSPTGFCRVHKSFIVALNKIKAIDRGVVIIAGMRIPIGTTYRHEFLRKIGLE